MHTGSIPMYLSLCLSTFLCPLFPLCFIWFCLLFFFFLGFNFCSSVLAFCILDCSFGSIKASYCAFLVPCLGLFLIKSDTFMTLILCIFILRWGKNDLSVSSKRRVFTFGSTCIGAFTGRLCQIKSFWGVEAGCQTLQLWICIGVYCRRLKQRKKKKKKLSCYLVKYNSFFMPHSPHPVFSWWV